MNSPLSSPAAAPVPPAAPRRRRIWPWVLGLCLAPFVILALVVLSFVTLDRDAAALRRHVMIATNADWHTKVQCSVGRLTIGAVRTGMLFVRKPEAADARLALAAVKHASVGVYTRTNDGSDWSREQLFVDTDRAMHKRGWTRLVGVSERAGAEAVLIYVPDDLDEGDPIDICVAVVNDRELVIASTTVDPETLGELVERHTPEHIKKIAMRRHLGL
ncbi:MAG: hypothetical protein HYV96_01070 [Opitutae bacterium]|nr:hypothetical protein [Opitutae bacterium]